MWDYVILFVSFNLFFIKNIFVELIFMTLWWVQKWFAMLASIGGIRNIRKVYSGACEVCSRWNGAVLLAFSLGLTCHYFLGDTVFSKVSLPWLNLSPVSLAFTSRLYDLSMFKVSWKTSIASLGSLSWCNEVFLLMFQQWIFLKEKRLLLKPRWNCYFFFP